MTYTPTVRKPTGVPAAPLIMVSGVAKSGKSLTTYKIGLSDRVAHTWVLDLGEGSADEYGALGCYDVLDWGRSFSDLKDTIRWCVAHEVPKGQLNAVIIDSGTELWDGLKDRATTRARGSEKNRKALQQDPDYEVDVAMPYWNDAKDTWASIVSPLRLAPHVVGVVIVRAEEVAEVVNGVPTKNRIVSLQVEKSLPGAATAHVVVRPDHSAWLTEVRSMTVSVPVPGGLQLDPANPLGNVIDLMAPPDGAFAAANVSRPVDEERDDLLTTDQRQAVIDLVRSVPDKDVREGLRTAFVASFGRTDTIPRSKYSEAFLWLKGRVDRYLETEPPSGGVGDAPPQDATDAPPEGALADEGSSELPDGETSAAYVGGEFDVNSPDDGATSLFEDPIDPDAPQED